ncbi:uncharacterized protein LOC131239565 [Magnolia sinica]|uniref:uncharacterized protein LOC131239565 n=1 Tax=Magnolia sinica TaxID=86752 RepID=UPI00265A89AD|nr:uncharacterized protein LOC131239565 [Magnolia sinica]
MEEGRRRPTLSHQMSVVDRATPRNLMKFPDQDVEENEKLLQQQQDNQTLASILQEMPAVPEIFPPGRTLLDIIGEEESSSAVAYKGMIGTGRGGHRINWKPFKDRLRLRRTGAAWSSSGSSMSVIDDFTGSVEPRSTIEIPPDGRAGIVTECVVPPAPAPAADPVSVDRGQAVVVEEVVEPPVKVSLMSLLQADSQDGSVAEEDEEDEEDWGESGEYVCCVCMVRHKGAAFIPCGHTFCRLCSRELWVSRGNCPLCNGYILEILDIF